MKNYLLNDYIHKDGTISTDWSKSGKSSWVIAAKLNIHCPSCGALHNSNCNGPNCSDNKVHLKRFLLYMETMRKDIKVEIIDNKIDLRII